MNTKQFTKLAAFVVTFALSVTVAGFFKPAQAIQAEKITALLVTDISNGLNRDKKESTFEQFVLDTEIYVSASEAIDYSGLPEDFTAAWLDHMRAWRNQANSLNEFQAKNNLDVHYRQTSPTNIEGEYKLADSVNEQELKKFSCSYKRRGAEIDRTWYEVLRIAKQHGAKIPANAY